MRAGAIVLLCLCAGAAFADPSERELDGHLFIPSLAVPDPFVATQAAVVAGAGVVTSDAPATDSFGNLTGRTSYRSSALAAGALFQLRLIRDWALRLGLDGGLAAGVTPSAALVLGSVSSLSMSPGTTVSFALGPHFRLGGLFDFHYSTSNTIDPRAAVQGSIATGRVDRSAIRTRLNSYEIVPGVSAAWAPHPAFGLVVSAAYVAQILAEQDPDTSDNVHNLQLGASAQLDLAPLVARAPVAFLVGYQARIPLRSEHLVTQDLEGGIYYTGRRALVVGVEVTARWFDLRPEAPPGFGSTAILGNAVLRSYWN